MKTKKPIYLVEFCGEIKQTKIFILKAVRRLTTRFREISKSQDRVLNITNHSEIWQIHLWQCCRDVSWISERCNDYTIASCGFARVFCGKMSYKITRLNPLTHCPPSQILVTRLLTTCIHMAAPLFSDWPEQFSRRKLRGSSLILVGLKKYAFPTCCAS